MAVQGEWEDVEKGTVLTSAPYVYCLSGQSGLFLTE